ncbi:SprT family protein [Streptococcus panodentis]|uniref:Protein SprT-like n=1 Tax=Streptococcus panodentis TaxID=1581472 RepID=A0ABS5AV52_9STRE|nr:SprT family protein [Streptococcus panodentis]MBP2620452.1 SprT family protein [Streptococcus panodentis]
MNLTDYVKQVSLEDFGQEFQHEAYWNKRLRTTGGRFFPKDGHLDFNPRIYETFGLATFRRIVRHELAHYHLYYQGKGYRHTDRDFKELLKAVDGLRYAPALPTAQKKLYYQCQQCQAVIVRKKRVDLQKYRCGRCMGKLRLLED